MFSFQTTVPTKDRAVVESCNVLTWTQVDTRQEIMSCVDDDHIWAL